jgi:hypothetical protein
MNLSLFATNSPLPFSFLHNTTRPTHGAGLPEVLRSSIKIVRQHTNF